MTGIDVRHLDPAGRAWAQKTVTEHHYRHSPVLARACPEAWGVFVSGIDGPVGCLILGRPQATKCLPWYGSLNDLATLRCDASRWSVLNLARVWLLPTVQAGGDDCTAGHLPGYTDRRGRWHSTLASQSLRQLAAHVGFEYLRARPPVFLDEPYEVRWLLSYCDSSQHRGVIYRAAGFELYRTNDDGLQTWRLPLPPLTEAEHSAIAESSAVCPRARRFRSDRHQQQAQLSFPASAMVDDAV